MSESTLGKLCLSCFRLKGEYQICPHCGYVEGDPPGHLFCLQPGVILRDRYIVGRELGYGGFGITYKAYDTALSIPVAIKEFFPSGLVNRAEGERQVEVFSGDRKEQYLKFRDRFMNEARSMALFAKEKDIVRVFDYFEDNNTAYIVMEYIAHPVMKLYLQEVKRIPERQAVTYACSILSALEKLHAHGIIHRDISPDNIFVVSPEGVKIFDFGAALLTKEGSEYDPEVVVKAGYAPPEQYSHKGRHDASTDVYAAGAVLYVMLTGEKPPESLERNLEDTLVMPSAMGITVSEAVENALKKALMLRQGDRFQTAADFRKALEEGMEKTSKQPAPEEGDRKERRRWRWR